MEAGLVHLFEVCYLFYISDVEIIWKGDILSHMIGHLLLMQHKVSFFLIKLQLYVYTYIFGLSLREPHTGVFKKAGLVKALSMWNCVFPTIHLTIPEFLSVSYLKRCCSCIKAAFRVHACQALPFVRINIIQFFDCGRHVMSHRFTVKLLTNYFFIEINFI